VKIQPPVRRRRRFPAPFGRELSGHWQRTHDLTPEAADVLAAIHQADADDMAAVALVLTASQDALDAGSGSTSTDAVRARIAELRRELLGGGSLDFWHAVARDSLSREGATNDLGNA